MGWLRHCLTMSLRIYARVKLQLGTVDALQLAIVPSSQYRYLTLVQLQSTEPRRACTYTDVRIILSTGPRKRTEMSIPVVRNGHTVFSLARQPF
jgi:hypothetical protein